MDLRDLYQEIILDHYKKPRNFALIEGANHQANGHNPLCGDRIKLFLHVEDGVVRDIRPAHDTNIWINGGFFAFTQDIFDYLEEGEDLVAEPFRRLIADAQLSA